MIAKSGFSGPNLFHSFEQFNINPGRGAYFTDVQSVSTAKRQDHVKPKL